MFLMACDSLNALTTSGFDQESLFNKKFTAALLETYPVDYHCWSKPNTLGGSFLKRGVMHSHDMKGTAEFIKLGEQVSVHFEFQVSDKSEDSDERQSVTVKREAVCEQVGTF
jgi:hypothetical protein